MNISKLLVEALALCQSGKLSEAALIYRKILKKYPKEENALANLGTIYLQQNNLLEAEKVLDEALSFSTNKIALQNLVTLKLAIGKEEEAVLLNQKLLNIDPKNYNGLINQAKIYRLKNQLDKAHDIYQGLINSHPDDINLYIGKGYLYNYQREYKQAMAIYEIAEKLLHNRQHYHLFYNMGVTYNNLREYQKSKTYFDKASKLYNQEIDLYLTQAVNCKKLKQLDLAFDYLAKAQKINPNNPQIYYQYGSFYSQLDRDELAKEYFDKCLKLDPEHVEAIYNQGLLKLKAEDYKQGGIQYQWRFRREDWYSPVDDLHIENVQIKDHMVIRTEQGIGDQILYLLKLKNSTLMEKLKIDYISEEKMLPYLSEQFPEVRMIQKTNEESFLSQSQEAQKINLASIINFIDCKNIPKIFFKPNQMRVAELKKKYKQEKLVGIAWKSKNESIGEEKTASLVEIVKRFTGLGYRLINLQYGDVEEEIKETEKITGQEIIIDKTVDCYNDIKGLSELIDACEFVVTTSNVTVHIAGAMNKRTILLMPKFFGTLWYWKHKDERNFSTHYPSVKIIEQEIDGKWEEVYFKLDGQLRKMKDDYN